MANHDDTTLPGGSFAEPRVPAREREREREGEGVRERAGAGALAPAADTRVHSDAPDRLVFFFSGFDPKGATFYHRLFRNGISQRNATHDDTLAVGGRHRIGRWASVWTTLWRDAPAKGCQSGQAAARPATMRTRIHFMRWDDIVRRQWRRSPGQLARDYWNVYVVGIATGVFARVRQKAPAAFWLALFPLGVALASLFVGLLLVGGLLFASGAMPALPSALAGLLVGFVGWRVLAHWIDCEWLLRLYAFTRMQAIGALPTLEARQDEMATHVVEAVEARMRQPGAPPLREILLVGYSTGSTMAAAVTARALHRLTSLLDNHRTRNGATLGIVTLGHCIPVAAEWRAAHKMRAELARLSECDTLTWHDYSAPADWAAFWRTPPWPAPALLKGHQASPRFHAQLSALEYAALRRDRREMHLQYLRPPARVLDADAFDYFMTVCGPRTLAERHAAIEPTKDLRG